MTGALGLAAALAASYLAGSFPTSIVVGKLFFGKDIRKEGSGNAGGTNAFRVFGPAAGFAVVLVDVGKGALAALLLSRLGAPSLSSNSTWIWNMIPYRCLLRGSKAPRGPRPLRPTDGGLPRREGVRP